jgi:hypothetical protein
MMPPRQGPGQSPAGFFGICDVVRRDTVTIAI